MMMTGIGMILVGLMLTGGVVYLGIQGQKPSDGSSGKRRSRKRVV